MRKLFIALLLVAVVSAEDLKFHVFSSRSIEEPPTIQVKFENGEQDFLELKHYRSHDAAEIGCNYLGSLQSDPSSSVAVTGCLNNPEDKMEVTMIADNIYKMLSVDFHGSPTAIKNPFTEEQFTNGNLRIFDHIKIYLIDLWCLGI